MEFDFFDPDRSNNAYLRRRQKIVEWHPWFAWRPIRYTGENVWVWLEVIERRLITYSPPCDEWWQYRRVALPWMTSERI